MKKVAWLIGAAVVLGCGGYVFVYLYRWEWHRALMMGIFLIAAEVPIATALVLRRLGRDDGAGAKAPPLDPRALQRIQEAAPQREHFAWLDPAAGRTSVFITMFVGGGILISGLAWALDRLASRTAGRHLEHDLTRQLSGIAFPRDGLLADQTELLAEEAPFEDDPQLRLLLGRREAVGAGAAPAQR